MVTELIFIDLEDALSLVSRMPAKVDTNLRSEFCRVGNLKVGMQAKLMEHFALLRRSIDSQLIQIRFTRVELNFFYLPIPIQLGNREATLQSSQVLWRQCLFDRVNYLVNARIEIKLYPTFSGLVSP